MFQVRIGDKLYTADSNTSSSTRAAIAKRRLWVQWIAIVYFGVSCVYATYSVSTQTGLGGYLMAIQMEKFGSAGFKATGALLILLLNVPLMAFIAVLHKVAPELVNASQSRKHRSNFVMSAVPWAKIFGIATIPLLVAAVVAPILYFLDHQELKETVYKLSLDGSDLSIPKDARFVRLTGQVAQQYAVGYRTDDTDHVFVPMTESTWTPTEPVRFIAYTTVSLSSDSQPFELPFEFNQSGRIPINGKISKVLPVVIERKYIAQGLKVSPACLVVDETEFPTAASADTAAIGAGIIGTMVAVLIFMTLALLKIGTRKSVARDPQVRSC